MTFTEEDVKNFQAFIQFVADNARFDLDWSESIQLANYSRFNRELLKKINDHVMELRQVVKTKDEEDDK